MINRKVMIITGGSRGIGAATALKAATLGYSICINYLNSDVVASKLVDSISKAGGKAVAVQADVSIEADVVRLFETCDSKLGQITHLVNNAGIVGPTSSVAELDIKVLDRVFKVNVIGCFLCAKEAIRRMSTKFGGRGGAIVNLSSRAGELGGANEWVHYAASKGAINTFTKGLAKEVASEGIRVNAVCPGLIDTDIHSAAGVPDRVITMAPSIPMKRAGTADEVADTIIYLLSDAATYISGACLDVGGGR